MRRAIYSAAVLLLLACWCLFLVPTVHAFHNRSTAQAPVFFQGGYTPRVSAISLNVYSPGNAALAAALNAERFHRAQAAAAAAHRYQAQAAFIGSAAYGSFQPRYVALPQQPFAVVNVPAYPTCNVPPAAVPIYPSCPAGASSLFYR